jgi:hypothetical protein
MLLAALPDLLEALAELGLLEQAEANPRHA